MSLYGGDDIVLENPRTIDRELLRSAMMSERGKIPSACHDHFAPFMIPEAFPTRTETASDSHPCCAVSVTYVRTHCFQCEDTIENHAERERTDVARGGRGFCSGNHNTECVRKRQFRKTKVSPRTDRKGAAKTVQTSSELDASQLKYSRS